MRLALGTVQFGMDYGVQGGIQPGEKAVGDILSSALDRGIDHFDTAVAYGNAEDILGRYIKDNPNREGKMHFISKLAPKAFFEISKDDWKKIVLNNVQESLERLNISELEVFLFHNAEYIFDENAVCALECARREGMARKVGVSIYTPQEAMKALEYEEIRVIQIPYNVFDQRLDKYGFFEKAGEKGVEVYARSSLLQGLLLMNVERLPEKMYFAKEYLKRFSTICSEYGVSPLRAAVCYVGRHPGIDYVLFGVDNKRQLLEYLTMQEENIPEDMVKELQKEFEDVEEKLVNPVLWNQE